MSRGMRLMILMLILAGVVTGMLQCAKRTMTHKQTAPPPEDGLAPAPRAHLG
jgi:hypothetical protein